MKTTKKMFSLFLALLLAVPMVFTVGITANAAEYNVSDYSALVSAVNSGASGSSIHLADNIVFPSEKTDGSGYSDLNFPNKSFSIYLDGHKLDLGAYALITQGALSIYRGTESGGEIIANGNAVTVKGANASLNTNPGVKISSRNGNGVISKLTKKRNINIEGTEINAPNGSAVFVGGYCTQLYLTGATLKGKYGITNDFSEASSPSGAIISNIYINSAVIDASEKVLNNNTENVGNGYTYSFYQIIRFYIKTGSFSENIFESYPDIQWRDPDVGILSSYPEMILYNGLYTIIPEIVSEDELYDALNFGGVYSLAFDITLTSTLRPETDVTIIGNGKTIKAGASLTNMFEVNSDAAGTLAFENTVIDGDKKVKHIYYNDAPLNTPNINTALVLKGSTVKGCKSTGSYGAIVTKGNQSLTFDSAYLEDNETPVSSGEYRASVYVAENCKAEIKNSDFNLKNGAKIVNGGELKISGSGSFTGQDSGVLLNRGSLTINDGEFESPEDTKVVENDGGTITVNGGTFSSELYDYVCKDKFMIRTQDNTSDGKYVVQDDFSGSVDVEDENYFGLNLNTYTNLQILGVQKKHDIENVVNNSQEDNNPEKCLRFITAVNEGIIKGNNVADYGYVVARISNKQPAEVYNTRIFNILNYGGGNGEKNLSCKGTMNSVVKEPAYGDARTESTTYKYVTLAVNNIPDGNSVAARFYVKTKDGRVHYGSYKKLLTNETLPGIAASIEALQ